MNENLESPETIYGRLRESIHISGYTAARACDALEWLLEEDRWKSVGDGFVNGNEFLATVDLSEFRIDEKRRKKLVAAMTRITEASQRAIGKALGVGQATVGRDLNEPNGSPTQKAHQSTQVDSKTNEPNGSPLLTQSGTQAAEQLKQQAEHKQNKEQRAKEIADQRAGIAAQANTISVSDRWIIHQADMRTWSTDKRFDWIITDPPYPKEFLPLYESLALRAKDWLKKGGLLVAMCGQSYLDQIVAAMSRHLSYYWTAAYLTPGQPTPLRQINVNTTWKPLLIFANGPYTGKIFGDVFKSDGNDKDFHEWGQSLSGMYDVVSRLALPGETILDPFCGAGTTGLAAIQHGCLFDGIDLDAEHCQISRARLNEKCRAVETSLV